MITREERSRKVKKQRLIKKALYIVVGTVFLVFLIGGYIDSQNNDIQLLAESHECKPNICEYSVVIHNTTNLRKSAFVRVTAYYRKSHPEGADTFPVVNSERIEVNLERLEQKELIGSISVPLKAHLLKFNVGSL